MRKKPLYSRDDTKPAGQPSAPGIPPERDPDEQVHSGELEIGEEQNQEDPDDRVHKAKEKPKQLRAEDNPQDPDDLVHDTDDEDDE